MRWLSVFLVISGSAFGQLSDAEFEAQYKVAVAKVQQLFPAGQDANSPFSKEVAKVITNLDRQKSALLDDPNYPIVVGSWVAGKMGIAPQLAASTPAAGKLPEGVHEKTLFTIDSQVEGRIVDSKGLGSERILVFPGSYPVVDEQSFDVLVSFQGKTVRVGKNRGRVHAVQWADSDGVQLVSVAIATSSSRRIDITRQVMAVTRKTEDGRLTFPLASSMIQAALPPRKTTGQIQVIDNNLAQVTLDGPTVATVVIVYRFEGQNHVITAREGETVMVPPAG